MSVHSEPRLLPRHALLQTSAVDHADWNYRPFLGFLQRRRFALLLALMGERRFGRLLEIGYGSGIFMPELRRHCDSLYGVDPHPRSLEIAEVLLQHDVDVELHCASVTALPFEDASMEAVLSVSALEFVDDLEAACAELDRVLAPNGALILVTPGHSPLLDLALRIATGEDADSDYGGRRQKLIPTLLRHFRLREERIFPPLLGRLAPLYRALRLERRRS